MVIPGYFRLPFPEVKRLKKTIHIMHGKVLDIIDYKRKQIERESGMTDTFYNDYAT